MSRHLWSTRRAKSAHHSVPDPQHLGIFAATMRAVMGRTEQPAPPADPEDQKDLTEADLPVPRPAVSAVEPPPAPEETTVEIPRVDDSEPAEPALSLLSPGRHSLR